MPNHPGGYWKRGSMGVHACMYLFIFIYFILFATLITKNIGKEEEKKRSGEET